LAVAVALVLHRIDEALDARGLARRVGRPDPDCIASLCSPEPWQGVRVCVCQSGFSPYANIIEAFVGTHVQGTYHHPTGSVMVPGAAGASHMKSTASTGVGAGVPAGAAGAAVVGSDQLTGGGAHVP
jgi:hypothetical protein